MTAQASFSLALAGDIALAQILSLKSRGQYSLYITRISDNFIMPGKRIVTGHVQALAGQKNGGPIQPSVAILFDGTCKLRDIPLILGAKTASLWSTSSSPADNSSTTDDKPAILAPHNNAASMSEDMGFPDASKQAGDRLVVPGGSNLRMTTLEANVYVGMHRSLSVDYNIITQGSLYLITPEYDEDGTQTLKETLCEAGDTVIQRGTLHAWRAGENGATWVTVILEALPVVYHGQPLQDVAL